MLEILIGLVVHEPFAVVIAVPAVLLYVGVSLMEPVFVAEARCIFGSLSQSAALLAKGRMVTLVLSCCYLRVWPLMCWAAIGFLLAYEGPLIGYLENCEFGAAAPTCRRPCSLRLPLRWYCSCHFSCSARQSSTATRSCLPPRQADVPATDDLHLGRDPARHS